MKRSMRWLAPAAGAVAVVALFFLLRPGEEGTSQTSESPAPPATGTPTVGPTGTETPGPTPTATPGVDAIQIEVEFEDGRVRGPSEVEVERGSRVRIDVEADVTDEVHVHGYDLKSEVTPDRRARIEFRASAPGVFEVELEEAGLLLYELVVTP